MLVDLQVCTPLRREAREYLLGSANVQRREHYGDLVELLSPGLQESVAENGGDDADNADEDDEDMQDRSDKDADDGTDSEHGCLSDPAGQVGQTLEGSFSSVSTPIFATKYSFCSISRDLQDS